MPIAIGLGLIPVFCSYSISKPRIKTMVGLIDLQVDLQESELVNDCCAHEMLCKLR